MEIILLIIVVCFLLACGGWVLRGLSWIGGGCLKFLSGGCGYLLFVVLFIMIVLALIAG